MNSWETRSRSKHGAQRCLEVSIRCGLSGHVSSTSKSGLNFSGRLCLSLDSRIAGRSLCGWESCLPAFVSAPSGTSSWRLFPPFFSTLLTRVHSAIFPHNPHSNLGSSPRIIGSIASRPLPDPKADPKSPYHTPEINPNALQFAMTNRTSPDAA